MGQTYQARAAERFYLGFLSTDMTLDTSRGK